MVLEKIIESNPWELHSFALSNRQFPKDSYPKIIFLCKGSGAFTRKYDTLGLLLRVPQIVTSADPNYEIEDIYSLQLVLNFRTQMPGKNLVEQVTGNNVIMGPPGRGVNIHTNFSSFRLI